MTPLLGVVRLKERSTRIAGRTSTEKEVIAMKTIAIRLEEEVGAQLAVLAQLEGSSVTELIRQGAELIIQHKRSQGELAAKAAGIVAEIDQEAEARKSASQALFGATAEAARPPAKARGARQEGRDAG